MFLSTPKPAVVVTGSSKGIGQAIALRFGRSGYHVFVTYNSDKMSGQRTREAIIADGGAATVVRLNVRDEQSVLKLYDVIANTEGVQLEVVVTNAVQEIAKSIMDASFDDWRTVVETKINGSFLIVKHALPLLEFGNNRNVIFITSHDGVKPNPDYLGYCVGTAGMLTMAMALSVQLGRLGIRVNAVSPGATRTPLWDALGGKEESLWEQFVKENPMGRVCRAEDVAEWVFKIVDDPCRFINGNIFYVNGGSHNC